MNATNEKSKVNVTFYYDSNAGTYSEGLKVEIDGAVVLNNKPSFYKGYVLEECILNLLYALGYEIDEVANVDLSSNPEGGN